MSSMLFPAATEGHRAPQGHLGTLSGVHSPTLAKEGPGEDPTQGIQKLVGIFS